MSVHTSCSFTAQSVCLHTHLASIHVCKFSSPGGIFFECVCVRAILLKMHWDFECVLYVCTYPDVSMYEFVCVLLGINISALLTLFVCFRVMCLKAKLLCECMHFSSRWRGRE